MKNLLDKIKLFFGICPCGGKLFHWDWHVWFCLKCSKKYYTDL